MDGGCVIVSGGSRGLGLSMVRHCLERGSCVATFARNSTSELERLGKTFGKTLHVSSLDVCDGEAIAGFVGTVRTRFGAIDALVNNAAIGQDSLLMHLSPEQISTIVQVNLVGAITLTRAVIRHMLPNSRGHVVNISSICGSRGYAGLSVYSATKGGMDTLTGSLARELGSRNILVNSVAPGFFASEMSAVLSRDQLAQIERRTPTGRLVEPNQVVALVSFLLYQNENTTGQVWSVDGGITA